MNETIGRGMTRQGRTRTLVAFTLVVGAAVVGLSGDPASAAGVPVFPDNLVIFPDRDFLSTEGFDGHVGENALVQVFRDGEVIGAAEVTLEPGGVPFEVNHPGGYCWGNDVIGGSGFLSGPAAAGTLPNVTPDIRPNDDIRVTFADATTSEITTQDAYVADPPDNGTDLPAVSGVDTVPGGDPDFIAGFEHRFTVRGRIATADPTFVEQRIVNPDLTDTAVGRRDIRAVPDPLGFLPDGNDSYMSRLVVDDANDTFVATYLFRDPAIATTAATGGGVRLLTWQATDLNANRQGITIAEFGEPGGPGFGGCPNGPLQSGPPGPSNVQAGAATGVPQVTVTWVPATQIPGTPPITGYRVHAVETTTGQVEQAELGRRINAPLSTGTTITGLDVNKTYDIQVVSVSDVGETFPAVHATFDTTAPMLSVDPAPGVYRGAQQVTLSSDEPGEIWYTVDGSAVLDAAGDVMPGVPGVSGPQRYGGPITVDADTTINAVAFDLYGNSRTGTFGYTITSTPLTPTLSGQAGVGSIDLSWDATVDASITQYTVTLYDAPSDGAIVEQRVILSTDVPNDSATFGSLTEGTDYWATIVAENLSGPSPESAPLGPLTPHGSFVADAGADQTVVRGGDVQLDGRASIGAAEFRWAQIAPDPLVDPVANLTGTDTATPSFTFPATMAGPVTFELTVTDQSGASGVDTVTITAEDVVANAGADRNAVRGSVVSLDGTGSSPATNLSYSWVSTDPSVVLTGASTATPSFMFPSTSAGPLTFELRVSDQSGASATDSVMVAASNNDPLAVARAEYRSSKNEWRINGAATVLVDNAVTLRLNRYAGGALAGTTLLSTGVVSVDAAGLWTVRYAPPPAERPTAAGSTYTITVTSSQGGLLLDEPITVRN
jgi:Chitobiase/beta-hexosaminidase C-terminal domain/K319L-like, PKD domain/Fibronectin type III domain